MIDENGHYIKDEEILVDAQRREEDENLHLMLSAVASVIIGLIILGCIVKMFILP